MTICSSFIFGRVCEVVVSESIAGMLIYYLACLTFCYLWLMPVVFVATFCAG